MKKLIQTTILLLGFSAFGLATAQTAQEYTINITNNTGMIYTLAPNTAGPVVKGNSATTAPEPGQLPPTLDKTYTLKASYGSASPYNSGSLTFKPEHGQSVYINWTADSDGKMGCGATEPPVSCSVDGQTINFTLGYSSGQQ